MKKGDPRLINLQHRFHIIIYRKKEKKRQFFWLKFQKGSHTTSSYIHLENEANIFKPEKRKEPPKKQKQKQKRTTTRNW